MDNNRNNKNYNNGKNNTTPNNKGGNKVNFPKFNLGWIYSTIAFIFILLWLNSDPAGAEKSVSYSELQEYVKKGYVSKCWATKINR